MLNESNRVESYTMPNLTTFDLEVVTRRKPGEFVHALFERIDVNAIVEEFEGVCEIKTENFEISAFDKARDAISEELGIEPTVFIQFRPRPTLDTDIIAVKHLLQAMDKWMHAIENDFVLVYNGESVMMFRRDCQLSINTASKAWTPARLSLITFAYNEVEMPALRDTTEL